MNFGGQISPKWRKLELLRCEPDMEVLVVPLLASLNHSDRCCSVHQNGPAQLEAKVKFAVDVGFCGSFQHHYCIISIFVTSYVSCEEIYFNFSRWVNFVDGCWINGAY